MAMAFGKFKKMLETRIFFFSNNVFHPGDTFHQLRSAEYADFRLFQTERVCRWQFQTWRKWKKVIQTGRQHCGKRRNCLLRPISPFPTVFSKGLFPEVSKGVTVWEWVKCHLILQVKNFVVWLRVKMPSTIKIAFATGVDQDHKCIVGLIDWFIEWCFMPLLTVCQSYLATVLIIHVFPGFHQYQAGALKSLNQGHSLEKTQRIQCGSNPRPLGYELNTSPLSHAGLLVRLVHLAIFSAFLQNLLDKINFNIPKTRVCIHKPFLRTFFVLFSRFFYI